MLVILLLIAAGPATLCAQSPGTHSFVRVDAGSYPIILSAPHGGYLTPDSLADRSCANCVIVRDIRTQEWADMLASAVETRTGYRPWVVINLLARTKLDANRDVVEAADGDAHAEAAWAAYHAAIEYASDQVEIQFGHGLLLDLHGHAHEVPRIELGYLISGSRLRQPDAVLDGRTSISSIRALAVRSGDRLSTLLRGDESFGQFLTDAGVAATPSAFDPAPSAEEPFFSGGYITARHGSRDGGKVDAIQLEAHYAGARDSDANVAALAEKVAVAAVRFIDRWYPVAQGAAVQSVGPAPGASCLTTRGDGLQLASGCAGGNLVLYDLLGRRVLESRIEPGELVRMPAAARGTYFARISGAQRTFIVRM